LNNEITRCTRCILPSTLKDITFDAEGVCNHCRKYEKDFQEWDKIKTRREKEFVTLLEKARSLNRSYDCLVPLSGGKDSTYVLYLCTRVYNLRTLAVTLDNGYLSGPAVENIRNALASCNADHIYYKINRKNSSALFRVFTQKTGDFCSACMRGINYSIELASKNFRIPLVIKGSGRRVQYVSQISEVSGLNTASYFGNVIRKTEAESRFRHFAAHKHRLENQKIAGGILDVIGVPRTLMMRYVPQHIGLYDYIYMPYHEIIDIIKREMNWQDTAETVEHLDCELHDIQFYKDTLRIPCITKSTFHRSGLIRQGILTREEAMRLEEADLAKTDPPAELNRFLQENDLDINEYFRYVRESGRAKYESKSQNIVRNIYHMFRKF
jgi:hypothetical protein